jgi:hypothetical protein
MAIESIRCRLGIPVLPRPNFTTHWNAFRSKLCDYISTMILTGLDIALPNNLSLSEREQAMQRQVFAAAEAGDIEALRRCMDGVSNLDRLRIVSAKTGEETALMVACYFGHLPVVAFLVEECYADIEQTGPLEEMSEGSTCLHYAVNGESASVVEYLLGRQAQVNRINENGWTPLLIACRKNNPEIARALIQHGADVNRKHSHGR